MTKDWARGLHGLRAWARVVSTDSRTNLSPRRLITLPLTETMAGTFRHARPRLRRCVGEVPSRTRDRGRRDIGKGW